MGMPCEVNSILKLDLDELSLSTLKSDSFHHATKKGYRILPIDVPIQLVDQNWLAHADIVISQLVWENQLTRVTYKVHRLYAEPFSVKG
ncbi:DUF2584 family protein [Leptolyngbya ohadii]|uniref:DUF2584 family protein n=1 Tax=Leptolyngbya ohadii TaxID=1962290 RepID=UPI000B5A1ACE|nr:DUF2584 family protein [Leptolyngbya ohadii]